MANPHPVTTGLKPFQHGNPGGPGRPRKRPQSEAHEEFLRSPLLQKERIRFANAGYHLPKNATNADGITLAMGLKAMRGDVNAGKELRESVEGKSKIRVEIEDQTKQVPRLVVVFEGNQPTKESIVEAITPQLPEPIDVRIEAARQAIEDAANEEAGSDSET
jgi:hypothetical protein